MKYLILPLLLLLVTCESDSKLQEGHWTGTLTPMNHPEMHNPVSYNVSYKENILTIELVGPGGNLIKTEKPRFQNDTLFFAFREPEEQMLLTCAFAEDSKTGFTGRCTDETGKWAQFTMQPPGQ